MILDNKRMRLKLKKVESDFFVDYLGYALERTFERTYSFDGESHDFTEIVYIEDGWVESVENEKVYYMSAGDIIFHAPMEFHRIKSNRGTSPKVYNLSAVLRGTVPKTLYDGVFRLDVDTSAEFLRVFSLARTFLTAEQSDSLGKEAADALAALIRRICRETPLHNRLASDSGAVMYQALVQSMNRNVYDNCTLTELAKENHVSISYMKTLFRQYADTSPKQYYAKLRITEAARLLLQGESAAAVAERMNFSSAAYFTVFFERHMGVTPSEYKKVRGGR